MQHGFAAMALRGKSYAAPPGTFPEFDVRHGGKPLDVVGHPAGHTAIVDTV